MRSIESHSDPEQHTSIALIFSMLVLLSCASTPVADAQPTSAQPRTNVNQPAAHRASPATGASVEFSAPNTSIALLVRELSEQSGRNIVLMSGLEGVKVGPYEKAKRPAQEWLDMIATDAGLRVDRLPAYDFVFPPGYETLNRTTMTSQLEPTLAARRTTLHFNLDTPLFSVLALLSHSLKTAIVADNVVADARCGEIHLTEVTVGEALDALLKSARVSDASLRIKSDADSILLYSAGRPLREHPLVLSANETRSDILDRRITLYLPAAPAEPGHLSGYSRAVSLSQTLSELAKQTGLHFEADARTHSLPVNPAVMVNVPLETALDLIVHQWPLPHFGYRVSGDTVRFVYLGPPMEK